MWGGGVNPLLIAENGELRLQEFDLGAIAKFEPGIAVATINETVDGNVWFGCDGGALRLLPDGRCVLYPIKKATSYDETRSIIADEAGRIWVGHRSGVFVFQPNSLVALANVPDLSVRAPVLEEQIVVNSGSISLPDEPGKMLRLMFSAASDDKSGNSANRQTSSIDRIFKTFDQQIWVPSSSNLFVFERSAVRV